MIELHGNRAAVSMLYDLGDCSICFSHLSGLYFFIPLHLFVVSPSLQLITLQHSRGFIITYLLSDVAHWSQWETEQALCKAQTHSLWKRAREGSMYGYFHCISSNSPTQVQSTLINRLVLFI